MKCMNCGKKIEDGCKFCTGCGMKVNMEECKAATDIENKENEGSDVCNSAKKESVSEVAAEKKEGSIKGKLFWISIFAICLGVLFLFKDLIIETAYAKRAEQLIESNPQKSIEYFEKAAESGHPQKYKKMMAEEYIRQSKEKIDYDLEMALELSKKAMEYEKSKESVTLVSDIYVLLSEKIKYKDIDQSTEYLKKAFEENSTNDIREKIIANYLEMADDYTIDYYERESFIEEARRYGYEGETNEYSSAISMEPAIEDPHFEANDEANEKYILPTSSYQKLTWDDIKGLSDWELRLARNEIYARHGYQFNTEEIREYFMAKNWYMPNQNFNNSDISEIEKFNIDLIKSYEK